MAKLLANDEAEGSHELINARPQEPAATAGSTANITQHHYAATPEALELIERILEVARGLEDDEVRAEAVESTEALESELRSKQSDPKRIRTLARGFWSVAQNAAARTTLGSALMKTLGIG